MEQLFQYVAQNVQCDKNGLFFSAFQLKSYTNSRCTIMWKNHVFWDNLYGKPYLFYKILG